MALKPARQLLPALVALITSAFLLSGCFPPDDVSVSDENSFPQGDGTGSGFSDSTPGDSANNSGLDRNQVRVSVQVPNGLAEGEPGRRNLLTTPDASLRVDRVDANLNRVTRLNPRIEADGDDFIMTFEGASSVPSDLDLVVSASVGSQTFRAPLATGSRHVRVNPFTHYLVERGLRELSQSTIDRLKSCNQTLCLQNLIWSPLADQVQNFEIDIPDNTSAAASLNRLGERADFAGFVDRAVSNLLLNEDDLESLDADGIDASAFEFNTVYFSAELNQALTGDGSNAPAFWASRLPTLGESTNDQGTSFAYPNLTIASFALELFDINITSLSADVPFERFSDGASPLDGKTNAHSTSPGPAFVRDQRFLTAVRPVLQTITRPGGLTIGWAPDPHFMDAWILGGTEEPQALFSSYFHGGKAIQLSGSTGNLQREQTREMLGIGSLEINLAKTDNDFSFSNALKPEYNLIGLELRADESGLPAAIRGRSGTWELSNLATSQADGFEDVDEWTLTPDDPVAASSSSGSFDLDGIEQARTDSTTDGFRGHLFINAPHLGTANETQNRPSGALTPNGDLMAFSLDTPNNANRGQLFQILAAVPETDPNIQELLGTYQIQGFSLGADAQSSRLQQFNGSCLAIANTATEIVKRGVEVVRERASGEVGPPSSIDETIASFESLSDGSYDNGRFEVANGADNVLHGIIAEEDGSTLVLLKRTEHSLGILLGFRDSDDPSDCE